jgi:hypothetical protein
MPEGWLLQTDNQGKTPAHYFALSGVEYALAGIKEQDAELLEAVDNQGNTLSH